MYEEVKEAIIKILGTNANDNNSKVSKDVEVLSRCVKYLATQIKITKRWCQDEGKEHVDSVLESTKKILEEF